MSKLLQRTFRLWWQKARPISDVPEERTVSFLELFYDLAYVVIIIQLTHTLAGHLDLSTTLEYIGLYAMVWFAWINGTFYHELHGNNDIRSRAFTFAQMFMLVWMAIFVDTAFSAEGYQGFAYAYGSFLIILSYLWWRTGVHDPAHRPLSTPYALAFVGAAAAFFISAQTSLETAQTVWLGAIAFILTLPIIMFRFRNRADQKHIEQAQRIRHSLVERFGLLTIIILGENLISIVSGASYRGDFSLGFVSLISASILVVFFMWWIYFDLVSERLPIQDQLHRWSWMYLHLLLTMSIGLVAVGLLNAIEYVKEPQIIDTWFIVGPIAAFLVIIAALLQTVQITNKEAAPSYVVAARTALLSVVGLLVVGAVELSTLKTVVASTILLALPVAAGILLWIKRQDQKK